MTDVRSPWHRRFPRAAAYMGSLPTGIDSFKECQILAEGPLELRALHVHLWEQPEIPEALRRALTARWEPKAWIPLTLAILQHLLIQDEMQLADPEYVKISVKQALVFLERPAYRAMGRVLSPNLLLMGIKWRWSQFYRGVELSSSGGDATTHTLRLVYPPGLFTPLNLLYQAELFTELLRLTGAARVRVTVTQKEPGVADFMGAWELARRA